MTGVYKQVAYVYKQVACVYIQLRCVYKQVAGVYKQVTGDYRQLRCVYKQVTGVHKQVTSVYKQVTNVYKPVTGVYKQVTGVYKQLRCIYKQVTGVYKQVTGGLKWNETCFNWHVSKTSPHILLYNWFRKNDIVPDYYNHVLLKEVKEKDFKKEKKRKRKKERKKKKGIGLNKTHQPQNNKQTILKMIFNSNVLFHNKQGCGRQAEQVIIQVTTTATPSIHWTPSRTHTSDTDITVNYHVSNASLN